MPVFLTAGADQRREALSRYGDRALVDDARPRIGRGLVELHVPGHEVRVADIGRRGDEAVDVDHGTLAEGDPARIDQHDAPFAVSLPAITEGSPGCTRFRVTELAEGCWKFVRSFGAMLKLCQSIAARLVDCTMSTWVGLVWVYDGRAGRNLAALRIGGGGSNCNGQAPEAIVATPNEVETAGRAVGRLAAARRGACAQLPRTMRLIRLTGCGRHSGSWVRFGLLLALCTSPTNIPGSDSARSRTRARLAINRLSSQPVLSRNGLCCQMDLR